MPDVKPQVRSVRCTIHDWLSRRCGGPQTCPRHTLVDLKLRKGFFHLPCQAAHAIGPDIRRFISDVDHGSCTKCVANTGVNNPPLIVRDADLRRLTGFTQRNAQAVAFQAVNRDITSQWAKKLTTSQSVGNYKCV